MFLFIGEFRKIKCKKEIFKEDLALMYVKRNYPCFLIKRVSRFTLCQIPYCNQPFEVNYHVSL